MRRNITVIGLLALAACGLPEEETYVPGTLSVPLISISHGWTLSGSIIALPAMARDGRCYADAVFTGGSRVEADLATEDAAFKLDLDGGCWVVGLASPVLTNTDGSTYPCTDNEDCQYSPAKAGVMIDGSAVVRYGEGAKSSLCYDFEVDRHQISFDAGSLDVSFSVEEI